MPAERLAAAKQPSLPMVLLRPASGAPGNGELPEVQMAQVPGAPTPAPRTALAPAATSDSTQAAQPLFMKPVAPTPEAGLSPAEQAIRQFPNIRQTRMQERGGDTRAPGEDETEYTIQLEPPGPNRLFRRDSEPTLQERMRQEARNRRNVERITFPDEPVLSTETYAPRLFPPTTEIVEPNYVCYQRLLFEQKNLERGGWDLGFFTPVASAGTFFFDVAWLPYHLWTRPLQPCECSAGYCLPGDPMPLLLYPPELSLTGAVMEAGTIVGLVAIFPG
jgi:hypothetical protein